MATINTVYDSGLDALANLYEVNLNLNPTLLGLFTSVTNDELSFRVQDFSIPSAEINMYQVDWGTWTFDRPNGKVNQTRSTSMTIRLDRSYNILQGFYSWKNSIQNEETGVISSLSDLTTDITVFPVQSTMGTSSTYTLSTLGSGVKLVKAFPSTIGDISYSQSSGDPLTLSVTWTYLYAERDIVAGSSPADTPADSNV